MSRSAPGTASMRLLLSTAIGSCALLTTAAAHAHAQEQSYLQGVVADETTMQLVPTAKVSVVGTEIETSTASDGTFVLRNTPWGRISIRVEAEGYPTVIEEVDVRRGTQLFVQVLLPSVNTVLNELLVVGEREAPESAPTAAELVAIEVPDLQVSSGNLGRHDNATRLRGTGSFTLSNEPAIFLDGVRLGSISTAMERLRQIPADDVKEIRILRGPAAAFLQGAANGAIYIQTRKGPGGER